MSVKIHVQMRTDVMPLGPEKRIVYDANLVVYALSVEFRRWTVTGTASTVSEQVISLFGMHPM
jgi:hypothetical protein